MKAGELSRAQWDNVPHTLRDGLSPLTDIPKVLGKVFPGFEFGKCDPMEFHDWQGIDGWVPLRKENWPRFREEWDAMMPLRYGLRLGTGEFDGYLMWGNDFLMVRPIDWATEHRRLSEDQREERHQAILSHGLEESQQTKMSPVIFDKPEEIHNTGADLIGKQT